MKKIYVLVLAVSVFTIMACVTVNPEVGPEIKVEIPELFSPDPDKPNDPLIVPITIVHPVSIKEWTIQVQPVRQGGGQGQRQARPEGEQGEQRQARERPEGEQGEPRQGGGQRQRRGPFFEQTGTGKPPEKWEWNGRSTREPRQGADREMVQSATDYTFTLTASDRFDNSSTFEGIISVDVRVVRDGDDLRIVVPSIVFPPSSANLSAVEEADQRANRRVLGLIGRALNRYEDYAITVEGHANPTTPSGTPEREAEQVGDKALSEQRAQAVVNFLVENDNVDRARLTAVGIGNARTVADYDDDDENWKNRRVEFILHK